MVAAILNRVHLMAVVVVIVTIANMPIVILIEKSKIAISSHWYTSVPMYTTKIIWRKPLVRKDLGREAPPLTPLCLGVYLFLLFF